MEQNSEKPVILSHFISQDGGKTHIIKEVVKPGSSSSRFLKKIELNRLSQSCGKSIDKRSNTSSKCYPYEYQKIVHHMDEKSIELFENLIHKNKGLYSEYIYQAVMKGKDFLEQQFLSNDLLSNNNRAINNSQKEKTAIEKNLSPQTENTTVTKTREETLNDDFPQVEIIPFGYHLHQHEVRMNYVSLVKILIGESHSKFSAKTIDISISGTKIKSETKLPVTINQTVDIIFEDMSQKGIMGSSRIPYTIIDFYQDEAFYIYRLQREYKNADDEIAHNLYQFINTQKRRYKIDLEDFKSMIISGAYERMYSDSLDNLPLFFSEDENQINLKYILTNKNYNYQHYVPEDLDCTLADYIFFLIQKLPLKKIKQLLFKNKNHPYFSLSKIIHIYSWHDDKGCMYVGFDSGKLKSDPFLYMINQGFEHNSFRIWELKIRQLMLPEINQSLNLDSLSSDEVDSIFFETESLSFLGIIAPVIFDKDEILSLKNQFKFAQSQFEDRLQDFQVNKNLTHNIELLKVAEKINRSENRYHISTATEIKSSKQVLKGKTIDFSPNGVKIKLDQELNAKIRDDIDISFTALQKKYPKEHLTNQHYRLTHLSGDKSIACFNRDHRFILHEASLFFRKVIEFNQNKLSACSSDQLMMIRANLFENILTHNLCSVPLLIRHKNQSSSLDAIAHDEQPSSILDFLMSNQEIQWHWLQKESSWEILESRISRLKKATKTQSQNSISVMLYLEKDKQREIHLLHIIDEYELMLDSHHPYLKKLTLHKHLLLKLTLTPAVTFPEKEFADELNEVRWNSKIDATQLKKRLRGIKFIGEFTDKTEFYMSRKAL